MSIRRAATAATTVIVAIACALAVPVASLRLHATVSTCCCPDPATCHCPDHDVQPAGHTPAMRPCHRSETAVVSPDLPAFEPAAVAVAELEAPLAAPVQFVIAVPHAPPVSARPDAPS